MDVFAPYEKAASEPRGEPARAAAFEARLRAAVNLLMDSPQGRLLLRWLLHLCRNFSAEAVGDAMEPSASARLFYTEGRRMVGMRLMRLMQQANPGHLPRLLQTTEDDAHDLDTF